MAIAVTISSVPPRLVPVEIRQEGMVLGSDGHLYPPQKDVEGRQRVVALLVKELGSTDEQAADLATVNLAGNRVLCQVRSGG